MIWSHCRPAAKLRPGDRRGGASGVPRAAVLLAVLLAGPAAALEPARLRAHQQNAWYNYFGNHAVSQRWGLHLEGQWRREGVGQRWMQLLLRQGVDFRLNQTVTLSGGYAYIKTHRYGRFPLPAAFPEHRFWQTASLRHRAGGGIGLLHRLRLEQRYMGEMETPAGEAPRRVGWRYENRFRYMLRADFPLTRKNDRPDWYVATYNETFVNFGRGARTFFDQNRAYLALGKTVNGTTRVEVGYMNQLVNRVNGRIHEVNHTLMLSVFSSLQFRR
jgi:hypothetical protein